MIKRSVIEGVGSYLPQRIVSNAELATLVDTSDEWIVERSGIKQRHLAAGGEKTSDLAIAAVKKALENAGRDGKDIDQRHLYLDWGLATEKFRALVGRKIGAKRAEEIIALVGGLEKLAGVEPITQRLLPLAGKLRKAKKS